VPAVILSRGDGFVALQFDFFDRVRLAMGAARRIIGSTELTAGGEFLPAARATTLETGRRRSADPLRVQLPSDAFIHFLCGGGVVVVGFLIFGIAPARRCRACWIFIFGALVAKHFSAFSGNIPLETALLVDFLAPWGFAERGKLIRRFTGGRAFLAQAAARQTHDHVRVVKPDQRRLFVVGPDRARLFINGRSRADRDRLVGRSKSGGQENFRCVLFLARRNHRPIFIGRRGGGGLLAAGSFVFYALIAATWGLCVSSIAHDPLCLFVVDR